MTRQTCVVDDCERKARHARKHCDMHHGETHFCRWNAHCKNRGKTNTCGPHTRMANAGMRPCQYAGCKGGHKDNPFFLCADHVANERKIRRQFAADQRLTDQRILERWAA